MPNGDRFEIDILAGPGNHLDELLQAFEDHNLLNRLVRAWPRFTVEEFDKPLGKRKIVKERPWFSTLEWLVWALWRRMPFVGKSEFPRVFLFALADRFARVSFGGCDLFIGWAQISLHSLKTNKKLGAITILEHPMVHVDTWTNLVETEYRQWGSRKGSYSRQSWLLQRRMRAEYQEADYITVLSDFSRESFVRAGIARERIVQFSLGVDSALFTPSHRKDQIFRVLYVGRLELSKGVQYLLSAFNNAKFSNAELCLVGPVLPEIHNILATCASPSVRVVGSIPRSELPAHYQRADVVVFPTVNDAFGLVILEAMACGVPVISTPNCAAPEIIEDEVDGFIVPIRDPDRIRDRLRLLNDNPERRLAMGRAARETVLRRFTQAHYSHQLVDTYRRIIRERESTHFANRLS